MEIDAATGVVTVTHQMAAHDAEPALTVIAPDAQPSLDDADALKALVAYCARNFVVRDAAGVRLPLTLKASDLDGDDVKLTFEGRLPSPARVVSVNSSLFSDINPDEANLVNVRRAKITQTALFHPGDDAQTIRFD